jgi:ATP-binding cassette subfamily B protein
MAMAESGSGAAETVEAGARRRLVQLVLPHLWPQDGRLRLMVVLAGLAMLAGKLVTVATPFALKGLVDELAPRGEVGPAAVPLALLLAYGAARLGGTLFNELRDAVFARVAERGGRLVARRTYEHLFALSLRWHLDRRTGELARAISRGVQAVGFMLHTALFTMGPVFLELGLVLGILVWRYPPGFAIVTILTVAVYAAFTIATTEWRTKFRREMNEKDNEFSAQAVDGLLNYEIVKAFGNEAFEARRLDRALAAYEDASVRAQASLSFLNAGQAAIIAVGVTVVMTLAARGVVAGELTVGDVVLVNAFLLQLYLPLNFLGVLYRELRQSLTDLELVGGLLERAPEIADAPDARPLRLAGGEVRFEGVRFAYDPRRPILEEVSFRIPAGRKVAIVGASGGGKSTIVRLLFRFFDVSGGAVLIDGQDVRGVTQASLRAAIGLVPQDTVLFNDTIAANIGYARPGAGRAAIEAAARVAQIHEFVTSLPAGYDTVVGERGLKLSGGEKQRVAIARVVLKDPPILVLDEATSALDTLTEVQLQAALQDAARGRTTLVIAHRLSTVVDADLILVLEAGRIVERGSHEQLLALGGLYRALWTRQHEKASEAAEVAPV